MQNGAEEKGNAFSYEFGRGAPLWCREAGSAGLRAEGTQWARTVKSERSKIEATLQQILFRTREDDRPFVAAPIVVVLSTRASRRLPRQCEQDAI